MAYDPYQQNDDYPPRRTNRGSSGSPGGGILSMLLRNPRVAMALVVALVGVVSYFNMPTEDNAITDQKVKVAGSAEDDVRMGLQLAPQMIAQHGGEHPDQRLQQYVDRVGMALVRASAVGDWASEFQKYNWDFHLLRDDKTINAFALPGGQIFFTMGLFSKLQTEDEVAGVLGHEIGHVIGRHSAQQMAKNSLYSGLSQAGTILTGSQQAGALGAFLGMKYGRDHETQSDTLGVQFMVLAGYNPGGLIKVMEVLKAAMGGARQPEFMSTHPDPGNRIENIKAVIDKVNRGELEGPKAVNRPMENTF